MLVGTWWRGYETVVSSATYCDNSYRSNVRAFGDIVDGYNFTLCWIGKTVSMVRNKVLTHD